MVVFGYYDLFFPQSKGVSKVPEIDAEFKFIVVVWKNYPYKTLDVPNVQYTDLGSVRYQVQLL